MHILLATDGSDVSLDATRRGLALLAAPSKVTLLTVVSDLPADTGGGIEGPVYTPEQEEDLLRSEHEQAERALAATQFALKAVLSSDTTVDTRIEMGDPASVIGVVAGDLGVDVVVVGSHGKGFLARVLLGSVSEHIARHAPCPVLVVRPLDEKKS
jgi:nucleotide-binding universal stress UspA family protein